MLLAKNDVPHRGELVLTKAEGKDGTGLYPLMPGVAAKMFDVPILLRVRGENVLYFNVKDKGIVTVTGCCHPGILSHRRQSLVARASNAYLTNGDSVLF